MILKFDFTDSLNNKWNIEVYEKFTWVDSPKTSYRYGTNLLSKDGGGEYRYKDTQKVVEYIKSV